MINWKNEFKNIAYTMALHYWGQKDVEGFWLIDFKPQPHTTLYDAWINAKDDYEIDEYLKDKYNLEMVGIHFRGELLLNAEAQDIPLDETTYEGLALDTLKGIAIKKYGQTSIRKLINDR